MTRADPLIAGTERRVCDFIRQRGVLRAEERVVLMLSGGADSMGLLALVRAADRRLGLGLDLAAVHVDYCTRGADSDRDRELVENACEAAGVRLRTLRLERPLGTAGFQARARGARYVFAREVAAREGADTLVTGHNRDDQAETVLYRLAKYASPRSLVGMRPRDADVARPLLCLGAAEVRAYCRAAGIAFGEDASNLTPAYARNALRLEVLPRLEALNPRVSETLAATALQAAAEADVLDTVAAEAERRVRADAEPDAVAAVDVAALAAEPEALRSLLLHDLLRGVMGGDALVERRLVEACLALAGRPGGGRASLGHGLVAAREGPLLVVREAARPHACAAVTVAGDQLIARPALPDAASAGRPAAVVAEFCGRRYRLRLHRGPVLDRAAAGVAFAGLAGPPSRVTLRHPRRGERFAPHGLGAETTVARFLAGGRVPPEQRRRAVVLDVDGRTAWVWSAAGQGGARTARVAEAFLVDESTDCTLTVELEEA
jgi:tRNA(Ile)-lysidine synthase